MSRSKKLPIYKDGNSDYHTCLRRRVKRRIRQVVKDIKNLADPDTYELPAPRAIINNYDWCDYILDYRWFHAIPSLWRRNVTDIKEYMKEYQSKMSRK